MKNISDKKIIAILKILRDQRDPLGGMRISKLLKRYGIDISHRTVRHYLAITDKWGLTEKIGRNGRVIVEKGREELQKSFVIEKVGFVESKIDELSYKMKFSMNTLKGNVVLNISTIDIDQIDEAKKIIFNVFKKGFGMGKFVVLDSDKTNFTNFSVSKDEIAIGTVCSITINGIFLHAGISMFSRFGGLLEIRSGKPARFTELINYNGSSLDPLEVFIKGKMTNIDGAVQAGNGIIGAGFREIPAVALPKAEKIKRKLDRIGLNGILVMGDPGQPLLDIPVPEGRVGMVVAGGLNPIAAVEEKGIETKNNAMGALVDFNKLTHYSGLTEH